jgi:hypothetical protein
MGFFSLLFILAGVGMTLLGVYKVRRAICSKSWPSTTGTITQSEWCRDSIETGFGPTVKEELIIT